MLAATSITALCSVLLAAGPGASPARGAKTSPSAAIPLPPPPAAMSVKPATPAATSPEPLPPHLRPAPQQVKPSGKAVRLAIPDVKVQGDLPARQLALFEGALLAEIRKLEGVSAIGMGEIREMLSFEYQRQMLGCAADEGCLAEIGGALGTDEMLHVSVIVVEKTATLTMKRIDMRSARVAGSDQRRLARANGEELLGAVGPAILALFPERALRAGRTRGVDREMALRLNPPPLPRSVFFATAGAAVAAAAVGAGYGWMARDARDQYAKLAERSLTESVSGPQLKELEGKVQDRSRMSTALFIAAGGLGIAAGVEAFFTDWHGYRAAVQVAPGAAGVQVGGRF
jgi:hypothetical protein